MIVLLPPLAAQETPQQTGPRVERFRLENGLTVLIERRAQLPLVNVTCLYRVGAANEVPGITGVAHYVEHMVFRGTENVSPADITGTFERIGGRWNAYTELDQTLYAETVPSWALESALRIEEERMSRARFDPAEFNRERGSVIAEINSYISEAGERLSDLVRMTSFEIHPYRSNTLGYDVPEVTRDEAFRFYKGHYGPNNAVLVIVGDVELNPTRTLVKKYFGGLAQAPRSAEIRVVEPPQRGEKRVVLIYPGAQHHVEWAFRAPAATHPDFPALLVLDALLSGAPHPLPLGDGEALTTSRLEQAVEAAGGSGAGTTLQFSRYANLYSLRAKAGAGTDIAKIEAAFQAELDRIAQQGASDEELAAARRRVRAASALEGGTLADSAHRLAFFQALGSWALDREIEQAAMRVTSADLQVLVHAWLMPEKRTVGIHRIGTTAADALSFVQSATAAARPALAPFVKPSPVPPQALRPLALPDMATARKQLANRVVVRTAQKEGAGATILVRLGFGSKLDPPDRPGLALLCARLLTSGSKFRDELDHVGAQITATAEVPRSFSAGEYFDVEVRSPSGALPEVMKLVGGALGPPTFTAEEVKHVREDLMADTEALDDDPAWAAREAALVKVIPGWRPAFGSPEALKGASAKDVNEFLAAHLRGDAVWVGIVAPTGPAQVLSAASQAFSGIAPAAAAQRPLSSSQGQSEKNALPKAESRRSMPGKTRVEIAAAGAGPNLGDADELPLRLLNYVIGETGYAGRLGRALTEPGLAYSVESTQRSTHGTSLLEIRTATAPSDLDATLGAVRRELKSLSENGVEEWEVQEAKAYRLGRTVFALDENPARVLIDSEYFGEDWLDFPARSKAILAVTREDLNRAARHYYDPARFHFGLAGALPPE